MNSSWMTFLEQAGAFHQDHHGLRFGEPVQALKTALSGTILCDLSSQGLIAVGGPGAQTFLQGQFTNDIRQVTAEHSQLSAYCDPKGRMLASFRVFCRDDVYYLVLPRENLEPIVKRLRLFVLRARVVLEDASATLIPIGLAGPDAERLLQDVLGAAPASVDQVLPLAGMTVIRVRGPEPRFEMHGELAASQALWTALATRATPVGAEPWRLLDILAGVPTIYPETSAAFVPQMTHLQLINGVSFQKGCYTGQEVVARTHYLGKLKRRMYRAHIDSTDPPKPGDGLFSPRLGDNAGTIVDACPHPDGGYEALAVVLSDGVGEDGVRLNKQREARLELFSLPYETLPDTVR